MDDKSCPITLSTPHIIHTGVNVWETPDKIAGGNRHTCVTAGRLLNDWEQGQLTRLKISLVSKSEEQEWMDLIKHSKNSNIMKCSIISNFHVCVSKNKLAKVHFKALHESDILDWTKHWFKKMSLVILAYSDEYNTFYNSRESAFFSKVNQNKWIINNVNNDLSRLRNFLVNL